MTQKTRMLSTLAGALLVAAGAGLYAWLGVFEAEKEEAAREAASSRLLGLERDAIAKVEVATAGQVAVLEKEAGTWRMVQPVEAPADERAVDDLVSRIADARHRRTIAGDDPAKYGLATPRVVVKVATADGRSEEVALGNRNDFDGSLFVRDARGRFVSTEGSLLWALDKKPIDLRDKRVVVVGQDAVTRIELPGAFTLAREGENWRIESPVQEKADAGVATAMVRALQDLRATAFAAEANESVEPARFGLEKPALEVRLHRGDQPTIGIVFGEKDGKVYARSGEGPVAEVPASILGSLRKELDELRDKRILAFTSPEVARIRFSGEGGEIEVEKRDENGDHQWRLVAPKEAKAKRWKIDAVVSTLSSLKADRFESGKAADYGLEKPRRTVTFFDAGGKELARLLVGKEEGAWTWVRDAGHPRIARVDHARLSVLPDGLEEVEEVEAAEEAKDGSSAAAE